MQAREATGRDIRLDLWVLGAAILSLNLTLCAGRIAQGLLFIPSRVLAGEYWRVLTHAFVHVSWYHLLIDGAAFLLLYNSLKEYRRSARVAICTLCCLGSLAAVVLTMPHGPDFSFCGLSGTAHGLMAISAATMIRTAKNDAARRRSGWIMLAIVCAKTLLEVTGGQMLFESLHLGWIGTPVTASHGGGLAAGLVCCLLSCSHDRLPTLLLAHVPRRVVS
jgi:rhomboid family GlyGly-CTERM serine protease